MKKLLKILGIALAIFGAFVILGFWAGIRAWFRSWGSSPEAIRNAEILKNAFKATEPPATPPKG